MEYIIIFILIGILFSLFIKVYKNNLVKKLIKYLENDEFDSFYELINSSKIKFLFIPFQVDYMKLNAAILQKNSKLVIKQLEEFTNKRLNNKQKEMIYMMAFNYFISVEDKKNSRKYLSKIKELNINEKMLKEVDRVYDIYMEKGYKYLDEIIEETKQLDDSKKGVNEFLISIMYENKNDKENAEKYLKLSEQHFKMLNSKGS